jgi:hypothetical protein
MTTHKWVAAEAQVEVIATAALDGDTDTTLTVGSETDNTSGLYQYVAVEVALGSINPTGTPFVELYIFYALDGTNYEDNSATLTHALVATLPVTTGSSAKAVSSRLIPILPFKYKIALRNRTGQTLATGGNSVQAARFYEQDV